MIKFFDSNLNKVLIFAGAIAIFLGVVFWFWWGSKEISIINAEDPDSIKGNLIKSSLAGVDCEGANNRPIAVMLPSDPVSRPLSGISEADIVFEMPVTPGGVTRLMAVFQCSVPVEIGSIRSAREDFIPLASGLGAVYVHWGGEKEALAKLNGHVIDNIDALIYETKYFYRKKGVKAPHNGFVGKDKLLEAIKGLKYADFNSFEGYPRVDSPEVSPNLINLENNVRIDYVSPYDVEWVYDQESETYIRSRGGKPEIDKNSGGQVRASVIVEVITGSRFDNKDYLTVDTIGSGEAHIYQNGIKNSGTWKKTDVGSKLFILDSQGKEMELSPGKIWFEIVTK